jgi:hypothetical protein
MTIGFDELLYILLAADFSRLGEAGCPASARRVE